MADLRAADVDHARLVFDIYDFDSSGKIDLVNLGDVLRSLNLNPTLATIEKNGGTKKKGEKLVTIEEFLPIFSAVKKDKDAGAMEDFMECLKLYDKSENGTMMQAELAHVLLTLGERMNDKEVMDIMTFTEVREDEEGFMKYEPFLKALIAGPYPEENKPE